MARTITAKTYDQKGIDFEGPKYYETRMGAMQNREMNIRLQKYKANRLVGMNQVNAAIAAGYSEKYARQACRIEKLVKVSLGDKFEQAGLTDKVMIAHALEGLQANKLGNPDWVVRHKYYETILKLTGKLIDRPVIDQSVHNKSVIYVWENNPDSIQSATVPTRIAE